MQAPQDKKLLSIERVVAFVLGPIVVAASGTLSAWLATEVGANVSPAEITGAFATGGLTAGAAVWKWLHGRQVYEQLQVDAAHVPGASGFIHTTLADLEGLAHSAAQHVAAQIGGGTGSSPPSIEPIPAASDPAPAGGQVAEQADVGAASGQ